MLKLTQTTLLTAGLIGYAAFSTAADRTFLIRRTTRSNQIGSRTGPPRSIARL